MHFFGQCMTLSDSLELSQSHQRLMWVNYVGRFFFGRGGLPCVPDRESSRHQIVPEFEFTFDCRELVVNEVIGQTAVVCYARCVQEQRFTFQQHSEPRRQFM